MPNKIVSLYQGQRFGRLKLIRDLGIIDSNRSHAWECVCDCGEKVITRKNSLVQGFTRSCGCLRLERIKKANTTHGFTKNYTSEPEYSCWIDMIRRCTIPSRPEWNKYGGRGIKVCAKWRSFEKFISDMGRKPSPSHTLDRIDNDGNYAASNCRWATKSIQRKNQRPYTDSRRKTMSTLIGKRLRNSLGRLI
jgi:hypothetical protein